MIFCRQFPVCADSETCVCCGESDVGAKISPKVLASASCAATNFTTVESSTDLYPEFLEVIYEQTSREEGMDGEPLERVRQYLQWRCRMKHFAGIACGIVKNGSLVFYQDAGYQDAEQKVKMSGDTIVRLFSMTKCLVAAAFCTYLEEPS
ncbi:unnamed protein product, partial [Symbiodinium sp. CCMP2456]